MTVRHASRPGRSPQTLECALLCGALALTFLIAGVRQSGLWDPHELDRAELARRVAIHVFGAGELALDGARSSLPTLSDLGSGELGFTSMAWGLARWGLHDWAGRLPLALWAVAGVLVLFVLMTRLVGPRAGLYSAAALCTMPLYFMQARTMLGDIVIMACFTAAFAGLTGALLDRTRQSVAAWLVVALAGLCGGYLARGALLGVAVPLSAVGGAWLVLVLSRAAGARPLIGLVALSAGVAVAWWSVSLLYDAGPKSPVVLRALGVRLLSEPPADATFDQLVRDLGHALFPWSALLPFAFGRILRLPAGQPLHARARETGLRVALLVGSATAYGAHALLAPFCGALAFVAPALLAAVLGLAIHDVERGEPPSAFVGVGTALFGAVLLGDLLSEPARGLSVFAVGARDFPAGFEARGATLMRLAGGTFIVLVLLGWSSRAPGRESGWRPLRRVAAEYRARFEELQRVHDGWLSFGFLLFEATLVGLAGMLLIGRRFGWGSVARIPELGVRVGLNAWWVLPLAMVVSLAAFELGRLGWAALLRAVGLSTAAGTVVAGVVAGGLLGFGYYPALAAQLSPKEVFETFARLHRPGQRLGLYGLEPKLARYYSGGQDARRIVGPHAAFGWLDPTGDAPPRRFLAFRREGLAELNSLWRSVKGVNLPVLDARSGQILLASNRLSVAGEPPARDENPLGRYLLERAPDRVQHRVEARLDERLAVLGWEIRDARGELVDRVSTATRYRMRFFYRVLAPLARAYQAFIHIDGQRRRHNGDHEVLGGDYRMTYWRAGDIVADEYELELEPNFMPGRYTVYYGFFAGSERLRVSAGPHHDNRIDGGALVVR